MTYTPPDRSFSGGQVAVSGQHTFGSTLTAAHSGFAPDPEQVEWQWLRNGSAIPFATGSSYQVTAEDVDQTLSVRATAYKPGRLPTSVESAGATVQPRVRTWADAPQLTVDVARRGRDARRRLRPTPAPRRP